MLNCCASEALIRHQVKSRHARSLIQHQRVARLAFGLVPVQPLDVHDVQAHGLAADVAGLKTLGLCDAFGDDVGANLLQVVVDDRQRLGVL